MVDLIKLEADGALLRKSQPPIQRAAYSDRTAWLMAILSELAYIVFEPNPRVLLDELAEDLMTVTGTAAMADRLMHFRHILQEPNLDGEGKLRKALALVDFELLGTFYNATLDLERNTEGYIARGIDLKGRPFLVIVFRGTTSLRDWNTNRKAELVTVSGDRKAHDGFLAAYRAVEDQIRAILDAQDDGDPPLFITGHSLGGAVAVMATWFFRRDKLAACYTFGAPRAGNDALNNGFRTPIYRVVNAHDPVPLVPPTGAHIATLKFLLRLLSRVALGGILDPVVGWLTKIQGYRHVGDLRHFTAGRYDEDGRPQDFQLLYTIGVLSRINRMWHALSEGRLARLDRYHEMPRYRAKLKVRALERAPQPDQAAPS